MIDLGGGPGAIALSLVVTGWASRATIVEPDPLHASLAGKNAVANDVADRIDVVAAEASDASASPADLVITNPPYFSEQDGAIAPEASRAASRALVRAPLATFTRAARRLLGARGRFVIAFPSGQLALLLDALAVAGLVPKRARFVHPRIGREAQVVFVEAKVARPGGLVVEPPLVVRGEGEDYTREADDALRGRWPTPER